MLARILALAAETTPPAAPAQPAGGGAVFNLLIPLLLVFVIMYLFVVAPQRKREKQRREMLDALTKGDDVVTIGGIYGKVFQTKENEVVLDVGGGVKLTFSRGAIARVLRGEEKAG